MSWNLIIFTALPTDKLETVIEKLDDVLDDAGIPHSKRLRFEINEIDEESRQELVPGKVRAEVQKELQNSLTEIFIENPDYKSPLEHGSIRFLLKLLKTAVVYDDTNSDEPVLASTYLKQTEKVEDLENFLEKEKDEPSLKHPTVGENFIPELEKALKAILEEPFQLMPRGQPVTKLEIRCGDDDFTTLLAKGRQVVVPVATLTMQSASEHSMEVVVKKESSPNQSFGFEFKIPKK